MMSEDDWSRRKANHSLHCLGPSFLILLGCVSVRVSEALSPCVAAHQGWVDAFCGEFLEKVTECEVFRS
jgi:hypothetical protein